MAYTPPTLAEFRTRFPEFGQVADAAISAVLAEAASEVGEAWIEADRKPATLYLTAHLLAVGGVLNRDASGNRVAGPVTSKSVGGVSVSYANSSSSSSGSAGSISPLSATIYGQRFLQLRRRSFPAVLAV